MTRATFGLGEGEWEEGEAEWGALGEVTTVAVVVFAVLLLATADAETGCHDDADRIVVGRMFPWEDAKQQPAIAKSSK